MHTLVLYNSRTGNTRTTADAIWLEINQRPEHSATLKSIAEVMPKDVEEADVLILGTWIQGFILFGVKPAGAAQWVPALPPLNGKPVGIFCTYAFNPRSSLDAFADLISAQGGNVVHREAFHRRGLKMNIHIYVDRVLGAAI